MSMSPKTYGLISLLLARLIPVLVALPAILYRNKTTYVSKTLRCMLGKNSGTENKIIFLFNIILPCLIVLICFICIFSKVRQVSRKMNAKKKVKNINSMDSKSNILLVDLTDNSQKKLIIGKSDRQSNTYKREVKITKMFGIIFTVFLFGYLPYGFIRSFDKNNSLNADVYILLTIMFIVSISVSPVIYGLMNTQIKIQCFHILKCIFFCCNKNEKQKSDLNKNENDYEIKNSLECVDISNYEVKNKASMYVAYSSSIEKIDELTFGTIKNDSTLNNIDDDGGVYKGP